MLCMLSNFVPETFHPLTHLIFKNQNLSLAERSQLQRAKQLSFLKNQGLIRDDSEIKGGAGAASVASDGNGSVVSVTRSNVSSAISFKY